MHLEIEYLKNGAEFTKRIEHIFAPFKYRKSLDFNLYFSATSPLSSSTAASSNGAPLNSHNIMNNNALFLLELASSSNSDLVSQSHLTQPARRQSQQMYSSNLSAVSELASLDPNPFPLVPFQCFQVHYYLIPP